MPCFVEAPGQAFGKCVPGPFIPVVLIMANGQGGAGMKGSCQCGAVRYEVTGEVSHVSHCHCSMCRKLHGALFVSFGGVARDDLKLEGAESLREYRSSDAIIRQFCATCGGQVFA